ncbi:probable G2/mitotic-specific cyclin-B1 [Phialocephala subalpina]|uniref:Probable G2/mitotic-specific cyclin-B1 n=1 Tax=Phialocephala subalpina TaxID=576137 RepID=A0A1L7X7A1_9HELO|nr:probable G2/mitotic-specific cyclin-B1 [Phialocephala subalpina]
MPPARATSRRAVTNENDENSAVGTTRLTRSKSAAFNEDTTSGAKKPLQSKKAAVNTQPTRKRAALGDVSNVTKAEIVEGKKTLGKAGLVSKAAQPTGVQKNLSRTNSSRSALGAKDTNKKTEVKRTGSGVLAGKRKTSSSSSNMIKEETPAEDEQPSRKKIHIEQTKVEVEETQEYVAEPEVDEKKSVKQAFAEGVEDLDREDLDDPLMVAEYVVEIFEYLKKLEVATRPNADYMEHQEDLEWKMRGILVDWLIEVHTRFHLLPETLFLAVNIIDRFLSTKVVQLDRLQLVGVTAMFIASKYEEVLSPHVANFRHVADDGFTEAEILSAERYVLTALNYDLSYPNPMNFLRRISKADNYDIQTRTLGKYLMEISLLDHRFMDYLPSHIAAAAMYLARKILERGEWDATLSHYAGYTEEEIEPVFKLMVDYLARPVTHEAFFKKYASKKFLKASILTRQWAKKNAADLDIDVSVPLDLTAR